MAFPITDKKKNKSSIKVIPENENKNAGSKRSNKNEEETRQSKVPLLISGLLIASLVATYFLVPSFHNFINEAYEVLASNDRQRISQWVSNFGFWGPIAIVLCMIVQMFLFVVPSVLLMIVAVVAYGQFWGAIISTASVMVAATFGYLFGRWIGPVTIYKMIGEKKEKKIEHYVEHYGLWAVVATRATPLLSNDAISFVAGLVKMNYWRFILATAAGIIPLSILVAFIGQNNDRLKTGMIWMSVISVAAFMVFFIYKKVKKS